MDVPIFLRIDIESYGCGECDMYGIDWHEEEKARKKKSVISMCPANSIYNRWGVGMSVSPNDDFSFLRHVRINRVFVNDPESLWSRNVWMIVKGMRQCFIGSYLQFDAAHKEWYLHEFAEYLCSQILPVFDQCRGYNIHKSHRIKKAISIFNEYFHQTDEDSISLKLFLDPVLMKCNDIGVGCCMQAESISDNKKAVILYSANDLVEWLHRAATPIDVYPIPRRPNGSYLRGRMLPLPLRYLFFPSCDIKQTYSVIQAAKERFINATEKHSFIFLFYFDIREIQSMLRYNKSCLHIKPLYQAIRDGFELVNETTKEQLILIAEDKESSPHHPFGKLERSSI
ncbi:hypothetical protein Ddc_09486 [Ditylenchus destructor]|nr:hypothetical protein Ddc_09486 [Ditylenchus destructor]